MNKEIELETLKKIELQVLCQVRDICVEQGIRYSLDGGTLLGAVRHGGFIPWDDDIDICMPRPDYERFVSYCKENPTQFGLACNSIDPRYCGLFAKAYDKGTVCVERVVNRFDAEYGVYIDIFPIDGLGSSREQALKLLHKSFFKRYMLVAANWRRYERSRTHSWHTEPARLLFFLLSRMADPSKLIRKIEGIYENIDFDTSKYVGAVCGCYGDKEVMDYDLYEDFADIVFENETFSAFKNYDKFLKNLYGDYMQLPPIEKRVAHHTFKAYFKD